MIRSSKITKIQTEEYTMTNETHKHHFQVADIGEWDLDQDRSIVPSI